LAHASCPSSHYQIPTAIHFLNLVIILYCEDDIRRQWLRYLTDHYIFYYDSFPAQTSILQKSSDNSKNTNKVKTPDIIRSIKSTLHPHTNARTRAWNTTDQTRCPMLRQIAVVLARHRLGHDRLFWERVCTESATPWQRSPLPPGYICGEGGVRCRIPKLEASQASVKTN